MELLPLSRTSQWDAAQDPAPSDQTVAEGQLNVVKIVFVVIYDESMIQLYTKSQPVESETTHLHQRGELSRQTNSPPSER